MKRLIPSGSMSSPLFLVALVVATCPFWAPLPPIAMFVRFLFHYLCIWRVDQRPRSPGGCWRSIVHPNFAHRFQWNPDDWISRDRLVEALNHQIRFSKFPEHRFPFVRVLAVSRNCFHIFPLNSMHGRLIRVRSLPPGYYGAGNLDPNFYSESPLRSVILSMHMGAYGKALATARAQCPYDVPNHLRPLLRHAGISDPPPHAETHSHPVHYALRNKYMSLAAKALQGDWYALFAGPDRINYLRTCGASAPSDKFLTRYEGKDITRYMGQPAPLIKEPSSKSPVWYVCDALHHLSASTVGSWFDKNPTLEYVIATTIIPPETLWDLPSLIPSLYSYSIEGDRLTYIPEKHVGSAYTQPLSGRKWLSTDALITPRNSCVHVSLLEQDYAHQLIVISRAPLLPQRSRIMAIANVSVVPWFIHPLGSLYQRITSPGLNRALQTYITRVGSTSIRDIYSKSTAHEVAVFEKYPQSFVRAGALYAKWLRDIDYHSASSWFTYVRWVFTMTTRIPLIPFRWWFQSYTSIFSQLNQDEAELWEIPCTTWVSQTTDSALPGIKTTICPNKLQTFQLQPDADKLSYHARDSAIVMAWLFLKVLGFAIWPIVRWLLLHLTSIVSVLAYALDIHWDSSPFGIACAVIVYWLGVRGPTLDFPTVPWHKAREWYYSWFAILYQLPSRRHIYRVGVSWVYTYGLNFLLFTFVFPRTHPLVFLLDHVWQHDHVGMGAPLDDPGFGNIPEPPPFLNPHDPNHDLLEPGFNVTSIPPGTIARHFITADIGFGNLIHVCYTINALLVIGCYLQVSRFFGARLTDYRPIHDVEAHSTLPCGDICFGHDESPTVAPTPTSPAESSDGNFPPYQATDDISEVNIPPPAHVPDNPVPLPPEAPLPPTPPLVPAVALPPLRLGDPLRAYNLPPRILQNFDNWQNLMNRLPHPPNQLDVGNMCVWDVLSSHLGVDAAIVWACYVSSLPPHRRAPFVNGLVPPSHLSRILNFFACTYIVRGSMHFGGCPRGPGGAPPCQFNPVDPPYLEGAGLEGFPSFTVYLQNNQDGTFHFSNRGEPVTGAPGLVPPDDNDNIGWLSRLVPAVEVDEVLNLPAKGFGTVYRRLAGNMANPLSMFQMGPRLQGYVLPAVPVRGEIVTYTPNARDAGYARALASDFKAKPIALDLTDFSPIDAARTLDQMAKQYDSFVRTRQGLQYPNVRFHIYHGIGGGGKSYRMIQDLAAHHAVTPFSPSDITFHTVDHNLRSSFMSDVLAAIPNAGLQNNNFTTGCIPLVRPSAGHYVFDDVGLTMNSFLPLFMACNPGITDIWVTFDAAQGQGVIPTANAISRSHPATKDWLSPLSSYYGTEIIRLSQDTADLYGLPRRVVPGRIAPRGQVNVVSQSPHNVPLLAVSPRFTQTQSMGGQVANTFQECQGHTIHGDVCVDLGGLTATSTDAAAWTALTRPTGHTFLRLGALSSANSVVEASWAKSQILTALLTVATIRTQPRLTAQSDVDGLIRTAVYSHLARSLSPAACANLGLPAPSPVIGAKGVSAEHRAGWLNNSKRSDYYTARTHRATLGVGGAFGSAFSRHTERASHTDSVAHIVRHFTDLDPEAVLSTESTGYELPDAIPITAQPDPVDDINEPTDDVLRETTIPESPFTTTMQHIHDGPPDALHHTREDKITDILGQRKRIKLGKHEAPWSRADTRRLRQLKRGFSKFFDMDAWCSEPNNPALMELCHREKLASWAGKRTKKQLCESINKQDLDMAYIFTKLFPKGQYIKKKAKWRFNAFASQTISDFHLGRIFRDSPYALYLEKMALKHALPSTYLHCRASPEDLSRWYRHNWRPGTMTGNDYTAWDSGIDHVFLEFDLWLMEVCHFPLDYRERFRFERLNTYSFLGTHRPRQESGDRWTWILNTLRNAALTGASIDCPKHTPICVSGDDSVTLGAWRRTDNFNPHEWLMVPKREEGESMEFCGLIFGGADVSFDPAIVHWRSRFGLQLGRRDSDYWLSIKQAIIETAAKLGPESPKLAGALLNLRRAMNYFNLPATLDIPDPPPPPPHPVDTIRSFLFRPAILTKPLRWLLFL
nr:MAG: RNA-dependent RNA polymerase [Agrostis stolonifera deltaflexivirus 1]